MTRRMGFPRAVPAAMFPLAGNRPPATAGWGLLLCLALALAHPLGARAGIIKTDIIFVQDVSGSLLGGSVPNLRSVIPDLAGRFDALGVDARYGLVTFQAEAYMPHVTANLTDAAGLQAAYGDPFLARYSTDPAFTPTVNVPFPNEFGFRSRPGGENPYDAIGVALNGMVNLERTRTTTIINPVTDRFEEFTGTIATGPQPELIDYRPDAIKNIVLLVDEPPQEAPLATLSTGPSYNIFDTRGVWANVVDLALQENALINVIVNASNVFQTDLYYRPLAENTGGNVFDLATLASNDPLQLSGFVEDFADTKFQELVNVCTTTPDAAGCQAFGDAGATAAPEPPVWALLFGGLLCMRFHGRSRSGSAPRLIRACAP